MKIVHIITSLQTGGAQNALLKHIKYSYAHFPHVNHLVISLSYHDDDKMQKNFEDVDVYYLNFKKWYLVAYSLFKLVRILRREKAEVIRTWLYHSDLIAGALGKLCCRSAIIWSVRSFSVEKEKNKKLLFIRSLCAHLSYYIPDKIVFNSKASLDLHSLLGYDQSKLVHVPNGFDISDQIPVRNKTDFWMRYVQSYKQKVILHVGRLHIVKDQATLLKGYELYRARTGNKINLVILGDGPLKSQLCNLIKKSKFRDDIYLLGNVGNVEEFMLNSDVFVLTSLSEAFPQVLGEAMSVGLPCIASDVGDVRSILQSEDFIFPASNAKHLSEILEKFFNQAQLDEKLNKQNIINHVQKNYSLSRVEHLMMNIYEDAL